MRMRSAPGGGRELDELSPYLRALRQYPPLTRAEEHRLAVRAGQGDSAAHQDLVRHSLALVVAVARSQRRGTVRLDDLVQEGNLGLLRAAGKYDPHVGTRFSTYAIWWIRAYVGKFLKEARSAVRPRSGLVARPDLSLDTPVGDPGDGTPLDLLEAPDAGPEDRYLASERDRAVRRALATARNRVGELGWDIVHTRLQQEVPRTLEDIGRRWSVSRERVRQVEVRTKKFLSRHLQPANLESPARQLAVLPSRRW
jgi:RNA polymerase primary sigma factor